MYMYVCLVTTSVDSVLLTVYGDTAAVCLPCLARSWACMYRCIVLRGDCAFGSPVPLVCWKCWVLCTGVGVHDS